MKGKKHSPEQIIKKLREADAMIATGKCRAWRSASRRSTAGGINTVG
jgi:hypothetical protein